MALETVPWFVGGGAEHSPDVARMVAYAATGGSAGVLGSPDFKVTELPVPTTKVRIAAGAAVIPNGYLPAPDFGKQSYIARAADVTDIDVRATGSSGGRTDAVVVRIDDPQFGGQEPVDPVVGPYNRFEIIENVSASVKSVSELNLPYPAVLLARIAIPASTGTITSAMVTDLRRVARPRRDRSTVTRPSTGTPAVGAVNALTSSTYVKWPTAAQWTLEVPSWATHAVVRADVCQYVVKAGNTTGTLQVKLGTVTGTDVTSFDENYSGNTFRNSLTVIDTIAIPADMRNTVQTLMVQGKRSQNSGYVDADAYTTTLFDVEFQERV